MAVAPPGAEATALRLRGGQAVTVSRNLTGALEPADLGVDTGWREGRLVFRQRALGEVLELLDRYRPGMIVLVDGSLAGKRVTGAFDIDDTDKALSAIERVMGLKIHHLTSFLTLVTASRS